MSSVEIPKRFWKYYDLYRRRKISKKEFSFLSGIDEKEISVYLKSIEQI